MIRLEKHVSISTWGMWQSISRRYQSKRTCPCLFS